MQRSLIRKDPQQGVPLVIFDIFIAPGSDVRGLLRTHFKI